MTRPYERPELKDLGSLQALTQQDKQFGQSDGFTLNGIPITNAS